MPLDLLIRGGRVYDGSGTPAVHADVAVAQGRIVAVGQVEAEAERVIEAGGLAVAPGFIDIHSHSDYTLLIDPRAVSAVCQGVTLEVIGNCGFGCAPIRDPRLSAHSIYGYDGSVPLAWRGVGGYLDRLEAARPAVNVMTLAPNAQLRLAAMAETDRPATARELAAMQDLLREALGEGAIGYSVGLEYPVEAGATAAELTGLAREAGRAGGLFATHTRKRAEAAAEAVTEVIGIAREAEVRLQVSHLMPRAGREEGERCIAAVERARAARQDVGFDMHTRLYGTTMLSTLLPAWAMAEGAAALRRHLASGAARQRIKSFASLIGSVGDWDRVILLDIPGRPDISRLSLGEIGRRLRRDPHDCALDILADQAEDLTGLMVLLACYTEESQRRAFTHPLCMPASDATTLAPDGPLAERMFHGAYTWAAWFWRALVREWRLLTPEEAVFRLTGLPGRVLGLGDRGLLKVGARADIAVFDPAAFGERGTTFEPSRLAEGMRHVIVNGVPTLMDGALTGARAGQVLRRRGPPVCA